MELWNALVDIIVVLTGALVLGLVFEKARQGALVGYLLAGTLLGPAVLNVVRNESSIRALSELGVSLLLFAIGLEFSWRRLRSIGPIALIGGSLQVILTTAAAAGIFMLFGLESRLAIALGAIIAPSSTACVLRTLSERTELESVHGRSSVGVLLLQDLAIIPLVLLVTTLGGEGTISTIIVRFVIEMVLAMALALGLFFFINYVLPFVLDAAALARNRELPILLAITICLTASWGAHQIDLSPALGAFVAGVLLAESPFAVSIRADVAVLRTVFVTMFFAAIGMLVDVEWVRSNWPWLLVSVPSVMIGKAVVIWMVCRWLRLPLRHAMATGLCLSQIGEFSFLLAEVGLQSQLLSTDGFRFVVAVSVSSLILTPYLIRVAPGFGLWAAGKMSVASEIKENESTSMVLENHVIIVGYGPAGQAVLESIRPMGLEPVIIDLNPRSIATARADGLHAMIGDATQGTLAEELNPDQAAAIVITVPDHRTSIDIARQFRALAPAARIFARARYHAYRSEFASVGAQIIDEESHTGQSLGRAVVDAIQTSGSHQRRASDMNQLPDITKSATDEVRAES